MEDIPIRNLFNQSMLLKAKRKVALSHLRTSLSILIYNEKVFSMRFIHRSGEWKQIRVEIKENGVLCVHVMIDSENEISSIFNKYQSIINIKECPLIIAVLLELKEAQQQYVLLIAYHLIVDGISWKTIINELESIYMQTEKKLKIT